MLAVALVSLSSLLLELALTRLFSVVLFYHFAFFAISVALLGLGSGGVFAHIRQEWLERFELRALGAWLCLLNSIFILAAVEVVLHTPVSLEVTGRNFGKLTIIYLAAAVPFFLTGLLFSVLFARSSGQIPQLYGADLAGGATACLAVVPLLNFIGAPNALLLASACMAVAAALWSDQIKMRRVAYGLAAIFVLLIAANYSGKIIDVIYAKGVYRDPKWVEYSRWNAISRIEVDTHLGGRYVVIDADATTAIMNVDPARWAQPGSATPTDTGLPATSGFNWKKSLMSAAPSVANVLRPHGEFAIIGPGGGVDVMRAVANGSPSVTGIEINPAIANSVMRGHYADYAFHLYELPQVHIHVQDGRSYVRSSHDKYDVVQMTLVDTWASTAAGAFALSENNLYTIEAFREYFDHLKPDGMIAITRWEFKQPREALRVVSQAIEALHQIGVANPKDHFVIIADGNLDEDGRPVLVLARKSPFTSAEYAAVAAHARENPNLFWLNPTAEYAGLQSLPPAAAAFHDLIESNDPTRFAQSYAYNVSPVSDSAPFFFFTLKTRHVIENIMAGTGHGMDWRINLGVVVLGMLLIISILAVLAFLILPLASASPPPEHAQDRNRCAALLHHRGLRFYPGGNFPDPALRALPGPSHVCAYGGCVSAFAFQRRGQRGRAPQDHQRRQGPAAARADFGIHRGQCGPAAVASLSRGRAALCDQAGDQRAGACAAWLPHGDAVPYRAAAGKNSGMGVGAQCRGQRPGVGDGDDHRHPLWPHRHSALRGGGLSAGGGLLPDLEKRHHQLERP